MLYISGIVLLGNNIGHAAVHRMQLYIIIAIGQCFTWPVLDVV